MWGVWGVGCCCVCRQADLISIVNATDIHGTKFDDPSNPIADDGKLSGEIVPATYVGFVDYLDGTQLGRFGLHDGASLPSPTTSLRSQLCS